MQHPEHSSLHYEPTPIEPAPTIAAVLHQLEIVAQNENIIERTQQADRLLELLYELEA